MCVFPLRDSINFKMLYLAVVIDFVLFKSWVVYSWNSLFRIDKSHTNMFHYFPKKDVKIRVFFKNIGWPTTRS